MPAVWAFHKQKWSASLVSSTPTLGQVIHLVVPSNGQVFGWVLSSHRIIPAYSRYLLTVEADPVEEHGDVNLVHCCSFH